MRISLTKEIALDQLAREIAEKLGLSEPPGLSYRAPGSEPGVLVLPDDLSETAVREVLEAHVPAETPQPVADLMMALQQAQTVEALRQALLDHLPTVLEGGHS